MRSICVGYLFMVLALFSIQTAAAGELMEEVQHGYVNNNGVKIHYVTIGEGPLVIMLHGYPDFWYTWRHQMKALSQNYQVVAIDLRGYNKSDKPKGVENYKMRYLIGDVAAVIQHFLQQKAIVVGHDWGGAIAWQVAMWRPNLVEKLIVLSTPHPNGLFREIQNNPEQQQNSQYARDFQKEDAYKELTAEGLAEWVTDEEAKAKYIEAFERSDFEAMLNYYNASFPSSGSKSTSNSNIAPGAAVRTVKCPTLGIFGLEDKALLASGWNGTWDWIENNLTLVSIAGAGHFVQHDNPTAVTNAIVSWLGNQSDNAKTAKSITLDKINPFDELFGTWDATQSIRNKDGSWSIQDKQYKWKFYPILEGEAVQDDWIMVDSTGREITAGTNIRIFNGDENQWHMAWIDKTNRRLATFTAVYENAELIMDGTNAKGRHIHNTFYNMSEEGFDWKQEWTFDEGKSWVEVARIQCKRRSQ